MFECTARCFSSAGEAHWTTVQKGDDSATEYILQYAGAATILYFLSQTGVNWLGRKTELSIRRVDDGSRFERFGGRQRKICQEMEWQYNELDDFDKKIARWCRKQYGTIIGDHLWENSMPDLDGMHGSTWNEHCESGVGCNQR